MCTVTVIVRKRKTKFRIFWWSESIAYFRDHPAELSNASFRARYQEDAASTLRHLGVPGPLIALLYKIAAALEWLRRVKHSFRSKAS